MATYKVPQDVEADDKLLGPFTFRQFVYLMIAFGLIMLAVGLFQIFPLLAVIPVPFVFFFAILALPLKKDQPMETYLAAIISFHTKPNKRYWMPGQSNSTILITAPKQVEDNRTRNLTGDEASHRLSFLAEIVDSEGNAIRNASTTMKDDFYAEAYNTNDMFDNKYNYGLDRVLAADEDERRNEVVDSMRTAIATSEYNFDAPGATTFVQPGQRIIQPREGFTGAGNAFSASGAPTNISGYDSPSVVQPIFSPAVNPDQPLAEPLYPEAPTPPPTERRETIQEEADRIRRENESETYVSLH